MKKIYVIKISSLTGEGLDRLVETISDFLNNKIREVKDSC